MYYYRLAVNQSNSEYADRFQITKITTTSQNANLALVSTNYNIYVGSGVDCFSLTKNRYPWGYVFGYLWGSISPPVYMIFSSNILLSNLTIRWASAGNAYAPKNISIAMSASILSYTDPNWILKAYSDIGDPAALSQIFYMSNNKSLIKQNGIYYSTDYSHYDTSAKTYIPLTLSGGSIPNTTDINNYGMVDISVVTKAITINGETFRPIDKLGTDFKVMVYK